MPGRYPGVGPAQGLQRQAGPGREKGQRRGQAGAERTAPCSGPQAPPGAGLASFSSFVPLSGFPHRSGPFLSPSCFKRFLVSHQSAPPQSPLSVPTTWSLALPASSVSPSAHPSCALLHPIASSYLIKMSPCLSPLFSLSPSSSAPLIVSPLILLCPISAPSVLSPSLPLYSASFWLSLCDLHLSFLSCSFHRNLSRGRGRAGTESRSTLLPLCGGFSLPVLGSGEVPFQQKHRVSHICRWPHGYKHTRIC